MITIPTHAGVPVSGSDMNYVNNKYYYDISRAGSVDATITMEFNGLNTPTQGNMYMAHWDGSEWDQLTTSSTTASSTSSLVSSFSPFTQGSGGVPLSGSIPKTYVPDDNFEAYLEATAWAMVRPITIRF